MAVTWRGHTIYTHGAARSWWGECSCGWRSTTRATEDGATGAALNHAWRLTVSPEMHDPEVPGRMIKRHGETMTKRQFMDALKHGASA